MKTMSGHDSESVSKQEGISYLKSWVETLHDRIKQGDPRKRLYEEQIMFLNTAIKALENQNCGCGICLAHNTMVCPLIIRQKGAF